MSIQRYDLLVIGAGAAGSTAVTTILPYTTLSEAVRWVADRVPQA